MKKKELLFCVIFGLVVGTAFNYMFTIENKIFTDAAAQHIEYVNTLSKE